MAARGRPATPLVAAAESAAREQPAEVQDGACNGVTVQDGSAGNATAGGPAAEGGLFRALEAEEVRRQGHCMVDFIVDYLQSVGDRPVRCSVQRISPHRTHSFMLLTPPPPPSQSPCNALYSSAPANLHCPSFACAAPTAPLHPGSPAICVLCCPPTPLSMANRSKPFSQVMPPPTSALRPNCVLSLAPLPLFPPYPFEAALPTPAYLVYLIPALSPTATTVASPSTHSFPPTPPLPPSTALHRTDISSAILPGVTHWQSPSFFAFFSSPTSAAAIGADALISALNVVGFSWAAAPAATELEAIVTDWLADLLALPHGFHSVKSGGRELGGPVVE
ncbi:unnamed protein product [Closterium sp. Naga37s-1]|nr:unnamed protein product [Closterium sp. Naga37s-1]